MKTGYRVTRIEHLAPPNFVEVINFQFSNEVYTVFWKTFERRALTDSVGIWKIKSLKN